MTQLPVQQAFVNRSVQISERARHVTGAHTRPAPQRIEETIAHFRNTPPAQLNAQCALRESTVRTQQGLRLLFGGLPGLRDVLGATESPWEHFAQRDNQPQALKPHLTRIAEHLDTIARGHTDAELTLALASPWHAAPFSAVASKMFIEPSPEARTPCFALWHCPGSFPQGYADALFSALCSGRKQEYALIPFDTLLATHLDEQLASFGGTTPLITFLRSIAASIGGVLNPHLPKPKQFCLAQSTFHRLQQASKPTRIAGTSHIDPGRLCTVRLSMTLLGDSLLWSRAPKKSGPFESVPPDHALGFAARQFMSFWERPATYSAAHKRVAVFHKSPRTTQRRLSLTASFVPIEMADARYGTLPIW